MYIWIYSNILYEIHILHDCNFYSIFTCYKFTLASSHCWTNRISSSDAMHGEIILKLRNKLLPLGDCVKYINNSFSWVSKVLYPETQQIPPQSKRLQMHVWWYCKSNCVSELIILWLSHRWQRLHFCSKVEKYMSILVKLCQ